MENRMPGLFIAEKIILAAQRAIAKNPSEELTSEALVKLRHGNISRSNARKNILSLKKLGILNQDGVPTNLGIEWANEATQKKATEAIIKNVFPAGICDFAQKGVSNHEFVAWVAREGNVTEDIAGKNITAFRILQRIAQTTRSKPAEQSQHRTAIPRSDTDKEKRRVLYIPRDISEQQFRMVMSATRNESVDIIMTS